MKRNLKIITAVLLTITAAILCAAILITTINRSEKESLLSSTNSDVSSVPEEVVSEESTTQNTSDTTTSNSQPTTSSKPSTAAPSTPSTSNQQHLSNNSSDLIVSGTGENTELHPISGLPFKQMADPETGISWDGVSPIIYTYEDGTTGTEKRDGAKYEYMPGVNTFIYYPKDSGGRLIGSICSSCGKEVGVNNYPNSCYQFSGSCYCHYCSVYVNAYACHTCVAPPERSKYCSHCGKVSGDGTEGTCLRYSLVSGDVTCPKCNATIPEHTCHTCGK